ncbi:hypothetical protein [Winogradskyella sp.]|jgi:hypothetical protein|uniref:hypothetical protein n=1 Tax=Winogradskyella sp. TaxID=1883156 RepID=UPI0025F53176|nr:hypothetical protein [Winogradskyella sp.]
MNSKKRLNILEYLKKRNVKRFSMFVAIAFVFLIISKLSNDYKQIIHLDVRLVGVEEEIILTEDSLNTINVLVEAKGFALVPYVFNNSKSLVLEVNKDVITKQREYIFDVQKHNFLIEDQLGSSYKILSLKPDTLSLPFSKRASKYVPIAINSNIGYAAGFDIKGDYNLSVDSAKIVGSTDRLKEITHVSTKQLKLKGVNKSIDKTIKLVKIEDVNIFPESVNVSAEVKRFTEGVIEVPIIITNKPKNVVINYFPKTVSVSYYVDLENYNSIMSNDFSVECNFRDISDNQMYFVPKITKSPKFIKRMHIKQKRVDFIKL